MNVLLPGVDTEWAGEGLVPVPGPKARAQPGKKTATLPLAGWGGVPSWVGMKSHPAGPGGALASDQSKTVACSSHTSSRVHAVNVYPPSSLSVTSARTGATGSLQRVLSAEPSPALAV